MVSLNKLALARASSVTKAIAILKWALLVTTCVFILVFFSRRLFEDESKPNVAFDTKIFQLTTSSNTIQATEEVLDVILRLRKGGLKDFRALQEGKKIMAFIHINERRAYLRNVTVALDEKTETVTISIPSSARDRAKSIILNFHPPSQNER